MSETRFKFGANWESFSRQALTQDRVAQARGDLLALYEGIGLRGKRFLDVGFGQGLTLFLAAEQGAVAHGVDIDPQSQQALAATKTLFPNVGVPSTSIGSILDRSVVETLRSKGPFDIVHAWGSLHHTGALWDAARNTASLVAPDGLLLVAIYQSHWTSPIWKFIKWLYNRGGPGIQHILIAVLYPLLFVATWIVTGSHPKQSRRGMEFGHDVVDWVGGYPYEYATVEEIRHQMEELGFQHIRTHPAKVPTGNNEMLFRRVR